MNLFKTVTVAVLRPGESSVDAHGNVVRTSDLREQVGGVLARPGGTSSLEASRPEGAKVDMTFDFPKGYALPVKGCRIEHAGRTYRVVGNPQPHAAANCPGPFGLTVECEAVDG